MLITTALLASFAFPAAPIEGPALNWHQGTIDSALTEAGQKDTLAALYFWRNGSEYCTDFYQNTLGDARVSEAFGDFVLLSAQHGTDAGNSLFEKYNIQTLPTMLFVTADGKVEDAIAGHAYADTVVNELDRIARGELTMSDLETKVAAAEKASEEHLELLLKQAIKFGDLGNDDGHNATLQSIAKLDKRGKTASGCTAHMNLALVEISESQGGDEAFDDWDLKPLHKLAKKVKNDEGRFEIWNKVANLEASREQLEPAIKAWMKAGDLASEDAARDWGAGVANYIMRAEGERTSVEKKFVLQIATRSNELAATMKSDCEHEESAEAMETGDCECEPPTKAQAYYMATLAQAYRINGDAKLASLTANRSITLDPSDENKERLSELL